MNNLTDTEFTARELRIAKALCIAALEIEFDSGVKFRNITREELEVLCTKIEARHAQLSALQN